MGEPPRKDYPPGWNDPPMLNYSPDNPPPKSRITNKRVAFPLGSASTQAPSQPSQPPVKPLLPVTSGGPCIDDLYSKSNEHFNKVLGTLENEATKEQTLQLLSAWKSGKFSCSLQNILADFATKLAEGNASAANEIWVRLNIPTEETVPLKPFLLCLMHLINPTGNK